VSFQIENSYQFTLFRRVQILDEIDIANTFVENKLKNFHQKQSLKISSFASSKMIINDHEFFHENVIMKKIFDF
jgi:hypothetical protein